MADEAYRAVFLRVHPTGKMVLSLTTEADGKEPDYAELVGEELGVPALDVKVVPGRHRSLRRRPRLQHQPVGRHAGGDLQRDGEDPRQGTAARRDGARRAARVADVGQRRVVGRRASSRRSRTSRCTRTAPARCRPASRAGSTRRRSTATDRRGGPRARPRPRRGPSASRTGRSRASCPSRDCVTVLAALHARRRRATSRSNASGRVCRPSVSSPSHAGVGPGRRAWSGTRCPALEHLVVDRLLDVGLVVFAEGLHAAGALAARAATSRRR